MSIIDLIDLKYYKIFILMHAWKANICHGHFCILFYFLLILKENVTKFKQNIEYTPKKSETLKLISGYVEVKKPW